MELWATPTCTATIPLLSQDNHTYWNCLAFFFFWCRPPPDLNGSFAKTVGAKTNGAHKYRLVHFRFENIKRLKFPVWKRFIVSLGQQTRSNVEFGYFCHPLVWLLKESGQFEELRIQNSPLLSADDVVLYYLRYVSGHFAAPPPNLRPWFSVKKKKKWIASIWFSELLSKVIELQCILGLLSWVLAKLSVRWNVRLLQCQKQCRCWTGLMW